MKRKFLGTILILVGSLALAAAAGLLIFILSQEYNADHLAQSVLANLREPTAEPSENEDATEESQDFEDLVELPDYILYPEKELPEREIDGRSYVGILTIPSLELELPILNQWSDKGARVAPCRYMGTPYNDSMILGAHNYTVHFGKLSLLKTGALITFEDMDGNVFSYEAVSFEVIGGNEGDVLRGGQWDMTLFTCTLSGQSRFVVRCEKISEN